MFESSLSLAVTKWAHVTCEKIDSEYWQCWQPLQDKFSELELNK